MECSVILDIIHSILDFIFSNFVTISKTFSLHRWVFSYFSIFHVQPEQDIYIEILYFVLFFLFCLVSPKIRIGQYAGHELPRKKLKCLNRRKYMGLAHLTFIKAGTNEVDYD